MANPFSGLFDTDNPAKKLQKEIEGMELKRQSLVASLQNEIQSARQKIDGELYQIGVTVYSNHVGGGNVDGKLSEHFKVIENLNSFIAEKDAKIKEIAGRYDDEIRMLNAHLGIAPPQAPQGVNQDQQAAFSQNGNAMAYCESCGKPYAVGKDLFCENCGKNL